MSQMKAIKVLNIEDMDVVVEPGLGWIELNELLKPYGFFFPLDPGPGALIGGMCATRCSGSLAVRYGTMKDNVISMKVVLANGDVIKTANRARKTAAGYDMTRLMIGTLGVITEVTLKLQKIPEASVVWFGYRGCDLQFSFNKRCSGCSNCYNALWNSDAYAIEQTLRVQKIAEEYHGAGFKFYETPEEKENLLKMRKEALWACYAAVPNVEGLTTNASQSRRKCLMLLRFIGDGNFHVLILFDPLDEEQTREAIRLNEFIVYTALSMDGTCTGEHGVGTGKMKYMEKELGYDTLKAMKNVKHALDPNNIMNPGKIIPSHVCL